MGTITIIDRSGHSKRAEATPGLSLMEIVRATGIDELLAICGGCCSCATCHIYLETGSAGPAAPDDDERYLLESAPFLRASSRLACQVEYRPSFESVTVTIAPVE